MIHASFRDGPEFPQAISKVVCVGRNYAAHAKELNNPVPQSPLLFIKPNSAVVPLEGVISLPFDTGELHYETELAVLIGNAYLCKASEAEAAAAIVGVGVALDLTLRDLQTELKKQGHPWEKAKAFDFSCPLSKFVPWRKDWQADKLRSLTFSLRLNGELRQQGFAANMLMPIVPLIAMASQHFTLCPGDVLLTGTPEGVGKLQPGDQLEIAGPEELRAQCTVISLTA